MEKEKKRRRKVMVVIDERQSSFFAFKWVLDNLQELIKSLPLVIICTVQQPPRNRNYTVSAVLGYARMHFPFSATSDLIHSAQEQNKKVAQGILEKAKSICASQGVNVEAIMVAADPREAICHEVQKHKIDLLVMGDPDNGTPKRDFQGSLCNYCLHNAKCEVVVVRKPACNQKTADAVYLKPISQ